jgi:hypothetical protein
MLLTSTSLLSSSRTNTAHDNSNNRMTYSESWACAQRIARDASDHLALGPAYALTTGSAAVFVLGILEGFAHLRPPSPSSSSDRWTRVQFAVRYGLRQIIPSIVWGTQPAVAVLQTMMSSNSNNSSITRGLIYTAAPPSFRFNWISHLKALRGAIAGSVILSQVFSLTDVLMMAKASYGERIRMGKAPQSPPGVVVRLAGQVSDVTQLSMARNGRRTIFPIFENASAAGVQHLVQIHGNPAKGEGLLHQSLFFGPVRDLYQWVFHSRRQEETGSSSVPAASSNRSVEPRSGAPPRVPIFWQVGNGRYSHASSWQGMRIPSSWLFRRRNQSQNGSSNNRLLVLEADATLGQEDAMSLKRGTMDDFDLDLYEVAQGFTKLSSLVKVRSSRHFDVLRVVLVDPEAVFESGGGRKSTAREYSTELGLADVVVDSRAPLVFAMTQWLRNCEEQKQVVSNRRRVVVLESPVKSWFESIRSELKTLGYEVLDRSVALDKFGSLEGIPFFVYEKSTADSIHTVRQLVGRGMVKPAQLCALCPRHEALVDLADMTVPGVTHISSSALYDQLLTWVRDRAVVDGQSANEIQQQLDENLGEILASFADI